MNDGQNRFDILRAALAPHGIFLRGVVHFDGDGPEMRSARRAQTIVLVGNVGGSIWPAFDAWRTGQGQTAAHPLDTWSMEIIRPLADTHGGQAYFPSERPWQPFQQWAMRAEGLKASPLGVLIHPVYGLWHGYRAAIGFADTVGERNAVVDHHPCDRCPDRPRITACPAEAVSAASFAVSACRSHIHSPDGESGCMARGCAARNACPVGATYRYPAEQLQFHMAALGRM